MPRELHSPPIARDTTSSVIPTGDEAVWTIQFSVRLQNDEEPDDVFEIDVTEYMDEWPGL